MYRFIHVYITHSAAATSQNVNALRCDSAPRARIASSMCVCACVCVFVCACV